MLTTRAILSSLLTIGTAGILLFADEPKKSGGSGILHPEMKVEGGSYDKPMGKLGEKPAQPWSATTTAAGVDGKPEPGHVVTRVGEIVDFSCYLQLGKHGEKHRSCGQKCVKNSQPVGLLTKDRHALHADARRARSAARRRRGLPSARQPITWATSWKSPARKLRTAAIARCT